MSDHLPDLLASVAEHWDSEALVTLWTAMASAVEESDWLVVREKAARADELRKAADDARNCTGGVTPVDPTPSWPSLADWLRGRADRIDGQ